MTPGSAVAACATAASMPNFSTPVALSFGVGETDTMIVQSIRWSGTSGWSNVSAGQLLLFVTPPGGTPKIAASFPIGGGGAGEPVAGGTIEIASGIVLPPGWAFGFAHDLLVQNGSAEINAIAVGRVVK